MPKKKHRAKLNFVNGQKIVHVYDIWKFLATSSFIDDRISSLGDQFLRYSELEETLQGANREYIKRLKSEIEKQTAILLGQKHDLLQLIEMMPDSDMKAVLSLRYLNSKRWEDVARAMNRPVWDVFAIHDKMIDFLERKYSG
jgi:hypothetical protein